MATIVILTVRTRYPSCSSDKTILLEKRTIKNHKNVPNCRINT